MRVMPARSRPAWSHSRLDPASAEAMAPIARAAKPAAAQVKRYPHTNSSGNTAERLRVIREYKATVGATDGTIMAAIITTQIPRNQPTPPKALQGPLSMPRISCAVHHHPTPAPARSSATSPRRARIADGPAPTPGLIVDAPWEATVVIVESGRPGELRGGQTGLALVGDPEGVDLRPFGFSHGQ